MAVSDLVAVAEEFGDQGRGYFGDEVLDGGVAGSQQVNAEFAQPEHDRLGVKVFPGAGSREKPRGPDTAGLLIDVLLGVDTLTRDNVFAVPAPTVFELTGHHPRSVKDWVNEHISLFAAPAA